ncbi:anti-phage protein KwaA [Paenibacillus sp. FSL L8-0493]|uniref:anti-phage protein KwaA n=1 Tax=Paenibacillus sp. FSL L8-0493 TaxID=2975333 RepID=UPI0030FD9BE1
MELYVISLWLLFLLIIIATIDIPVSFSKNAQFIGIKKLVSMNSVPLISLLLLLIGIAFIGRFKYKLQGSMKTFTVIEVQDGNFEHLTFLTTYIVPLISFNLGETRNVLILFLLLIAIGAICIKTQMFYANPTLAILGFHIYIISGTFRTGTRLGIIVISRDKIVAGSRVKYRRLDEKIYFARLIQ